ncbi:zinc finger and BTB domain-containing protein 49 [Ditylenchus destructor]|uniref:Zinc finger and BTB domain-containing protein 49 n=1 Tax=Ditylenchus destructor TaxID=166010 RepID=A0AAD4RCI8_9BILA|nr:zinc finger and BTB domain-containing protein 49 [Ditylenchus destructor]
MCPPRSPHVPSSSSTLSFVACKIVTPTSKLDNSQSKSIDLGSSSISGMTSQQNGEKKRKRLLNPYDFAPGSKSRRSPVVKQPWRACMPSSPHSGISSAVVSPSTSSTNGSVTDVYNTYAPIEITNNAIAAKSSQSSISQSKSAADVFLEEVQLLSESTQNTGNETIAKLDQVTKYKEPDPFDGVVERVNGYLNDLAPEYDMTRKVMDELMSKLMRYSANEPTCMFPKTSSQTSMSDLLNMVNIGNSTEKPSLSKKNISANQLNRICVSPSPSLASTSTDAFAPPPSPASTLDESSISMKSVVACQICQVPFASTQSMVRHVKRKHPNQIDTVKVKFTQTVLPFACSVCHKSFASEGPLKMHMRRHDEEKKTHKCPICPNRAYILASELRKHIKTCHENKKEEQSDDQEKAEESQQMDASESEKNSQATPTNGLEDMPNFL